MKKIKPFEEFNPNYTDYLAEHINQSIAYTEYIAEAINKNMAYSTIQGIQGTSGNAGVTGVSGIAGISGPSGISGYSANNHQSENFIPEDFYAIPITKNISNRKSGLESWLGDFGIQRLNE